LIASIGVTSQPPSSGDPNEDFLWLCGQVITKHWPKASAVELEKDKVRFKSLSPFEQLYLRARWHKLTNLLLDLHTVLEKYDSERGKLDLIGQLYGDTLGLTTDLAPDVAGRLDWYKQRIAREFEKTVKSAINTHGVQSPIEQIFLIEWSFLGIDHVYGVRLEPQKELKTPDGIFKIDFAVSAQPALQLAIEIDGHDFHEKTKAQASHDKSRERSIVRAGYIILRFSGSEVFQNPRKCVNEVVDVIKQRQAGK
jgi:very-short-patch-repair endonuclease